MTNPAKLQQMKRAGAFLFLIFILTVVACVSKRPLRTAPHRWWSGMGPVLPHDSFPADCKLCHVGPKWNTLRDDFEFDHKAKTGVELVGAHKQAACLRCHNDRGPVTVFANRGCVGCHEDFHYGQLDKTCTPCHTQDSWRPFGQIELHNRTRFPLVGAHTNVACYRCHPGARVGKFVPTDTECLTCHRADLAATTNPPHIPLGYTDRCHRCHIPTRWEHATLPD
ncbi:MAG: hypothetical protein ACYTGZ_20065 [Planctomycetota bacterium]|jgi:hypothetical protein